MPHDIKHDEDIARTVVDALSEFIRAELLALSNEHWTPRYSADQMDAELAFRRSRIVQLRAQREQFENAMFGMGKDI